MLAGHQEFTARIGGYRLVQLPPFEFVPPEYPNVERVELRSPDERQVSVRVVFGDVPSQQEAKSIARLIALQVADRIAFEFSVAVGEPVKGEAGFVRRDGSVVTAVIGDHLPLVSAGHTTLVVKADEAAALKAVLAVPDPAKDVYYAQFRWILGQDDHVARFMHLYRLLLSLKGGPKHTQKLVDDFIEGREPAVQKVYSDHTKRDETIYTRLRNEVGHEIKGVTPASTRQGMEQQVDRLAEHVKAAISEIK